MNRNNIFGVDGYTVVPTNIMNDCCLSLAAVGFATYIAHEYQSLKIHNNQSSFFESISNLKKDYQGKEAYDELVSAGYINDFLKEGIEI